MAARAPVAFFQETVPARPRTQPRAQHTTTTEGTPVDEREPDQPAARSRTDLDGIDGTRVAVAVACHNRRQTTLRCLDAVAAQAQAPAVLDVYLVDDASSDGTAEAVAQAHPAVTILHGDGSLYWNGGMRRALDAAMRTGYDRYLLLNDDTTLDPGALSRLLVTETRVRRVDRAPPIIVGATRDPDTGRQTYGGLERRAARRPLRLSRVELGSSPQRVDSFEGNCVLVPSAVTDVLGNLDPGFVHAMGDNDYGLRATAAGFEIWVAPGTVGTCAANPLPPPGGRPLREELRALTSLKQLPPRDWATFARRWAGPLWPIYWASPYLRRGSAAVRARLPGGPA